MRAVENHRVRARLRGIILQSQIRRDIGSQSSPAAAPKKARDRIAAATA